jgi:hypothetical protein
MPDSIVPFRRDDLDVAAACALISGSAYPRFSLYSETAAVCAGYFSVKGRFSEYVDRIRESSKGAEEAELLPPDRVSGLIEAGLRIDERAGVARVPVEADSLLIIDSWAIQVCNGPNDTLDVDLTLLNVPANDPGGASQRRLCRVKLLRKGNGEFHLATRAEATLQIHAASLAGQWILLDSPVVQVLIPPPDFATEGSSVEVWIQPRRLMVSGLGVEQSPFVPVGAELARGLMRRHRWCAPREATEWLAAVRTDGAQKSH